MADFIYLAGMRKTHGKPWVGIVPDKRGAGGVQSLLAAGFFPAGTAAFSRDGSGGQINLLSLGRNARVRTTTI